MPVEFFLAMWAPMWKAWALVSLVWAPVEEAWALVVEEWAPLEEACL